VIGLATPTGAGLPGRPAAAAAIGAPSIPITGIPVLVLHGPLITRAALGMAPDALLVRPLAPLLPSVRLKREEIITIEVQDGHWYAFGRRVVYVRRSKGQALRLMAPPLPGTPDGTDNLGRLLRAWWRAGQG